jgi:hypothetical protein
MSLQCALARPARNLALIACAATLTFAPAAIRAAGFVPVDGVHFAGNLLDGTPIVLPDAANGKPCIVVVGMTKNSSDATERLSTELAKREGDRVPVFSIALLDKAPGFIRGFIIKSLRKQYDLPDGKAPGYFVTVVDGTSVRRTVPPGKEDDPVTFVFDAHGKLIAAVHEPYSEDSVAGVLRAAEAP